MLQAAKEDVKALVEGLNFKEKVDRSLGLIEQAYKLYGDSLVVDGKGVKVLVPLPGRLLCMARRSY